MEVHGLARGAGISPHRVLPVTSQCQASVIGRNSEKAAACRACLLRLIDLGGLHFMSEVQALEGSKIRDLRLMEESSRDKKQITEGGAVEMSVAKRQSCLWKEGNYKKKRN